MLFIKSTIFNIIFYMATAVACILCLPGLLLPKEKAMYIVSCFVNSIYFLEKHILGLDFEVKGSENLPKDGAFLVAAKHQSPYETFKLHIIFNDPAIILKRELLKIPLWGKFLAKTEPIAIDRSQGKKSMLQIVDGAKKIKEQGRPIVIFPQGTRVYTWQTTKDKPYKSGVARIHAETEMPIIPMALNTGSFWPRTSWIKHGGKITFEFLEPVKEKNDIQLIMKDLETRLEARSNELCKQAEAEYNLPAIEEK
jgi:1-acyl-sn-glycerol-3-phosphate acyltransferase